MAQAMPPIADRNPSAVPRDRERDAVLAQADATPLSADAGRLLLRLLVGLLLLAHGISKLQSGPAQIVGMLAGMGLPGALAYLVYVGEVLAPLLLIVGWWTRPAALVAAINMVVAVGLAHADELFAMGPQGGYALELQAFFLFGALAIALLGAGRFSVGGRYGRWN